MGAQDDRYRGFTLIELLVVMAAIGLLLSLAAPRYSEHTDHARDVVLKQNLLSVRDAIDKFFADHARYPKNIDELVRAHYLRTTPMDPITDRSDSWIVIAPAGQGAGEAVFDIRSGAPGQSRDGKPYASF